MTTQTCYYPAGNAVNSQSIPPMVPCDPAAKSSACCATGDACSEDGLCVSSEFFFYRGACTDGTWVSSACPSDCISTPSYVSGFQVVSLCENPFDSGAVAAKIFTCNAAVSNCATSNFTRKPSPVLWGNITGELISTPSPSASTVTLSEPATSTPSTTTTQTRTHTPVLLAAVIVPVVLLVFLLLVGWCLYRQFRKRRNAEKVLQDWNNGAMATRVLPVVNPKEKQVVEIGSGITELPARE